MRQILDEAVDKKVLDEWYDKARKIQPGELSDFMDHLANDYIHDYGTICHAITAAGIGAMMAMNHTDQGWITEFQASCIMWLFVKHWIYTSNETGLKMVNYDDMLYPQYEHKFDKIIEENTWKAIQKAAKKRLDEIDADVVLADDPVVEHWRSIAAGMPPFGYKVMGSGESEEESE